MKVTKRGVSLDIPKLKSWQAPKEGKILLWVIIGLWVLLSLGFFIWQTIDKPVIVYSGHGKESPFWIDISEMMAETSKSVGVKLIDLTPNDYNDALRVETLMKWLDEDIDGIILGNAGVGFDRVIDSANEKNLPLIIIDSGNSSANIDAYIATDNYLSGQIAGEYILNNIDNGSVLIICGEDGHSSNDSRRDGARDVLAASGINVIVRHADWLTERAFSYTSEELSNRGDIVAIFACWDPAIDVIFSLVEGRGLQDDILLVGFDGIDTVLQKIDEGKVDATIMQPKDQFVEKSLELMKRVLNGEEVNKIELIPGSLVIKENIGKYL